MKSELVEKIKSYYDDKLKLHGATAKGVDWKNEETQATRFELLSTVFAEQTNFTVNDLGCGYGAFAEYLLTADVPFAKYYGYDISDEMIQESKKKFSNSNRCVFTNSGMPEKAQFTVSSGIFNVKLDTPENEWKIVVDGLLATMNSASESGFSFNMLKQPTAESFRRDHLFYAEPAYYEKLCSEKFGDKVRVLTHESLYEFTVVVSHLRR